MLRRIVLVQRHVLSWTAKVPSSAADLKPGEIVLDVDVATVASWISPNPGGVGHMTRALLLANVVETAERAAR